MIASQWQFERWVTDALDALPQQFQERLENIEVSVEDWPSRALLDEMDIPDGQTLFGLYQGVPLTQRTSGYGMVPPDRITIYRGPIEEHCRTADEARAVVAHTVRHEIAHFFGISDERLDELGAY